MTQTRRPLIRPLAVTGIGLMMLLATAKQIDAQTAAGLDPSLRITQYVHTHWGVEEGLPQSSVYAMLQTRDGYLWLGTQEGLVRFDGHRFTVFDRATLDGLLSNEIRALVEDRNDGLWIGTNGGGISLLRNGKVTTYTTEDGLASDLVRALYQDEDGVLWIGTIDGGLDRFDGRSFTRFDAEDGLPGSVVLAIEEDEAGLLWVGTEAGLTRFDGARFSPADTDSPLARSVIWSLHTDADGALWAGASGGLLRLQDNAWTSFTADEGLCGNTVDAILRDNRGALWVGTLEGGLCRTSHDGFESFSAADGLSHDRVRALAQDAEGNLWIGTEGGGLDQLRTGRFTPLTAAEGLSSDVVFTVLEDRSGTLWVGTEGGGLNRLKDGELTVYTTADGLPSNDVYALHEDASGRLWVGLFGGGICEMTHSGPRCFSSADGLASDNVYAIAHDAAGDLWIGTDAGLNLLRSGKIEPFAGDEGLAHGPISAILRAPDGGMWVGTYGTGLRRVNGDASMAVTAADGLTSEIILSLAQDGAGTLWIGTQSGGLCRLRTGLLNCFTTRDGLHNDNVLQILDDGHGSLWLASNRGISRIRKSDVDAFVSGELVRIPNRSFDRADGLESSEASGGTQPAAWRSRDGRLWFSTVAGVASIDPTHERRNQRPPPVVIERVEVDGDAVGAHPDFDLSPKQRDLSFHYTALSYAASSRIQFAYILEGYDEHWVNAGTRRDAYYTALEPGRYTFRVRAANADGVWNDVGTAVTFEIQPWFYETTWFAVLLVVLVLGLGIGVHRVRIERLKARERELERIVDERTHDLRLEKEKTEEARDVIAAQAEKLRELDRFKTRFFANVSHEFRTPLTMIVGPLENALSGSYGPIPERMRKQIEIMLRNALRLLRLINQLLDLSKLEAGKMELQAGARNIVGFLDGVVLSCTAFAEQKEIDLSFQSDEKAIELYFEPDKLEKVFFNLLSNAIKFTPRGGQITVTLERLEGTTDMEDGAVSVRVIDTGRGIPAEQLEHVFDRFHQVDGSNTREFEGSGIGLSLVRELVLLHRGGISVQSELGQGTTFIVTLPLGRKHLSDSEIREEPEEADRAHRSMTELASAAFDYMHETDVPVVPDHPNSPPPEAPLILVVDDNKDVREYVAGLLGDRYRVQTARDGRDGLDRAREIGPDCIISDVMMPRMDGNEFCRLVKASPRLNHIPVILLTARATHDTLMQGLEGGADDYLAKPFNAEELRTRVANLLHLRKQERDLKELNDDLERKVRQQVDVILDQRRRYESELIEARDRAEASERLKSAILDNMNHELRTPLTAILGYASILRREADGSLGEFAAEIARNSERLMATLDAVLELSRLEGEVGAPRHEVFDLAALTRETVSEFASAADNKGIRLSVRVDAPLDPVLASGDGSPATTASGISVKSNRAAIRQALRYLLDNALKFTEDGEIEVYLAAVSGTARVAVRDTGIGIDTDFLPRVFDAFSQQSDGLTRTHAGVGLGLTVAQRLVTLAGGEIQAASRPGEGSTFTVTLPEHGA